jgi:hypothetical protein
VSGERIVGVAGLKAVHEGLEGSVGRQFRWGINCQKFSKVRILIHLRYEVTIENPLTFKYF